MFIETRTLQSDALPIQAVFILPAMDGIKAAGERVEVRGSVQPQAAGFHLTGRLTTRLGLPCSRCTTLFTTPVEVDISLLYRPEGAAAHDDGMPTDLELTLEDCTQAELDSSGRIDLLSLAQDQIYLWLPLKAICRPDCRGMCSHCGTDLNTRTCDCTATWHDPRLAPLAELKKGI